jgi:hypothetical protein
MAVCDNRLQGVEFRRLRLFYLVCDRQHLMAVSQFQFLILMQASSSMVILAGACYLLKRLDWLCLSVQDCLLVITLTNYFGYMSANP